MFFAILLGRTDWGGLSQFIMDVKLLSVIWIEVGFVLLSMLIVFAMYASIYNDFRVDL